VLVAQAALVIAQVALVVPEDPVVPVVPAVRGALVVSEDPVVPAVRVVSESPVVPVALVVPESPVVALELAIGLAVVPELETAPVVALALDQVVVALRIRLVTAAHPHDLVPLLAAAEDLAAAVAETTREPAAAEAVIAWEVAE
jgi:hypothetical protein